MAPHHREVVWSERARNGLDEAVAYIAKDSPDRALDFLERALVTAESLDQLTQRGRIVPELNDPYVRELFVYSYRLVYEVSESRGPYWVFFTVLAILTDGGAESEILSLCRLEFWQPDLVRSFFELHGNFHS